MTLHLIQEYPEEVWWSTNKGGVVFRAVFPEGMKEVDFDYWCYKNCHIVREFEKRKLEYAFDWEIKDEREIAMFLLTWGPGDEV